METQVIDQIYRENAKIIFAFIYRSDAQWSENLTTCNKTTSIKFFDILN